VADEHRFSAEVETAGGPVERKSGWKSCLTGCLIVCVILAVIAILIGVWVGRNVRNWTATGITEVVRQGMASSQLPAQEQQEIMVEVERVSTAFRDGSMSFEQLGLLAEKFAKSPLMTLVVATAIEQGYIAKSGLTAEEKAAGGVTLNRFIRGALDDKIKEPGIDAAMAHVADRDANGAWQLRQKLTDDELKAFLAEAKKQADEAGIPEQPAAIDPSIEVRRIVDEALNAPTPLGSEPAAPPASE
jgi:hypothetical protein